jgi:hypothetical protein
MNVTVSPQIRILALVGLVGALGLGASMFVLGRGGSKTETHAVSTSAAVTSAPATTAPAVTHASTTPAKPHTTPVTKPVVKPHTTPAKSHTATKTHHAKPQSNKYRGYAVYSNLPAPLQWQLAHHKVVVVSLYNPRSDVDAISVAEAHQGATDAKVGFLLVNVLDNKVAGLLTALLPGGGLLPDPGVLVYRAPGEISFRLDGFNDRATVAQAAVNALSGQSSPVTSTSSTPPVAAPAVVPPPTASDATADTP